MDGGEPLFERGDRLFARATGPGRRRRRPTVETLRSFRTMAATGGAGDGGGTGAGSGAAWDVSSRVSSSTVSLEIGIVLGERQGGAVLRERLREIAAAVQDFGEAADRGEVFRRALQHLLELGSRGVELVQLEQRAAERDARREIAGVERRGRRGRRRRLPANCPARRYSSASWAKAIDAGSFWTRRRRSSSREWSAMSLRHDRHVHGVHVAPERPWLSVTVSVTDIRVRRAVVTCALESVVDADRRCHRRRSSGT